MSVTLKWKYPCDYVPYSITTGKNAIYLAFYGSPILQALNLDGTIKWLFDLGDFGVSYHAVPLTDSADNLYIIVEKSVDIQQVTSLYVIDSSGVLRWSFYPEGSMFVSNLSVMPNGLVCVITTMPDGSYSFFYVLNHTDGSVIWKITLSEAWRPQPPRFSRDGRVIYVVLDNMRSENAFRSRLYAIASDGSILWTYDFPNESTFYFDVGADGTLYLLTYSLSTGNFTFWAIDPLGILKWNCVIENGGFYSFVIGSAIYATNYNYDDNKLYAISDGKVLWKYVRENTYYNGTFSDPAVDTSGTIYTMGFDDNQNSIICALNPDGTLKWESPTPAQFPTIFALGKDKTLYLRDGNTIYAYQIEDETPIVAQCQSFKLAKGPHGGLILPV